MIIEGHFLASILVYAFRAAFETKYEGKKGGCPLVSRDPSLKSLRNSFNTSSIVSSARLSTFPRIPLTVSLGIFCTKDEKEHDDATLNWINQD